MTKNTGFGRGQGRNWGGRRKMNPDDAPKVTRKQVLDFAAKNKFEIKRNGNSHWWLKDSEGIWRTAGITNYLVLENMKRTLLERG
jgi:hypothetical protein